ncbi:MAG: DUF2807 domain-containing protein [Bacteroidota bacterium]
MKSFKVLLLAILTISTAYSQSFERKLRSFDKIIVSPKINLVLTQGEKESIKIDYSGVDEERIVIEQKGRKVHVYLEDAKIFDIGEREDNMFDRRERYAHATLTAYVTFKHLALIETRGEGDVYCEGKIETKKLKIKAWGATDIRLAYVDAATVKVRLYGENVLNILDGDAGHLSYKMYGVNKIDTRGLRSVTSNATVYGEGRINLNTTEELRLNSFGEPRLDVIGDPVISKGMVFGKVNIRRR